MDRNLWVFGYGSLIWRPAFPHAGREPAWIEGFARRFWQASPDHRGVPEAPGRVATLVERPGARCGGVAYRVAPALREQVLATLDARESGGFERREVAIRRRAAEPVVGLAYVAGPGNPNFLGPSTAAAIARQIRSARGPSGSNDEYLLRLRDALRELSEVDAHVEELAALVKQLPVP